jgi:hypothetical protein
MGDADEEGQRCGSVSDAIDQVIVNCLIRCEKGSNEREVWKKCASRLYISGDDKGSS